MKDIPEEQFQKAIERLTQEFQPDCIYLFGSHAYGTAGKNSDVDIMVVVPQSDLPPHKRARHAYRVLGDVLPPAEVIVDTREEFEERSEWISTVERTIKERGQVIYEKTR